MPPAFPPPAALKFSPPTEGSAGRTGGVDFSRGGPPPRGVSSPETIWYIGGQPADFSLQLEAEAGGARWFRSGPAPAGCGLTAAGGTVRGRPCPPRAPKDEARGEWSPRFRGASPRAADSGPEGSPWAAVEGKLWTVEVPWPAVPGGGRPGATLGWEGTRRRFSPIFFSARGVLFGSGVSDGEGGGRAGWGFFFPVCRPGATFRTGSRWAWGGAGLSPPSERFMPARPPGWGLGGERLDLTKLLGEALILAGTVEPCRRDHPGHRPDSARA